MASYAFPALSPHQSRTREPTDYEMSLAGAIEAAFGAGHATLPALVTALNASRVRRPDGSAWTEDNYCTLMRELGG